MAAKDLRNDLFEAADYLVALWENQRIAALPRAERNAAVEEARDRLVEVVKDIRKSAVDVALAQIEAGNFDVIPENAD